eukprot:TRINITY_DN12733_c0_g1_i4.p1 TRINITY_DN12733_c0_g1~~TRINITY_DN12733_c0_g1_i4.p1  ORF type:complete len:143 (-),score=40.15 TRINITY_DN12733_c0_g1_i4:169-597(-)
MNNITPDPFTQLSDNSLQLLESLIDTSNEMDLIKNTSKLKEYMFQFIGLETQLTKAKNSCCLEDIMYSIRLIKNSWKRERLLLYDKCKESSSSKANSTKSTIGGSFESVDERRCRSVDNKHEVNNGRKKLGNKSCNVCAIFC